MGGESRMCGICDIVNYEGQAADFAGCLPGNQSLCQELEADSRRSIETNYSISAMVSGYLTVYRTVAEGQDEPLARRPA